MSANTTRAPRSAKALAVDTNVNAGTITSSPGPTSSKSAASSSAWVHEVVSSTGSAVEPRRHQRRWRAW
jgi:hypothetical protein